MNHCRARCVGRKAVSKGPCGIFDYQHQLGETCECKMSSYQSSTCSESGQFFESDCVLDCFNLNPSFEPCKKPCNCPFYLKPECGSDGTNYINSCYRECAGANKLRDGKCQPGSSCDKCFNLPFKKVCGNDGNTYDNECYLECGGKSLRHIGECIVRNANSCNCKDIYLPVCGVNNKTYKNQCKMLCKGISLKNLGKCSFFQSKNSCYIKSMTKPYDPVCGIDEITYYNQLMLQCGGSNRVAYKGYCTPVKKSGCNCS